MNNYTVLLLRPIYMGESTYLAHVIANGVADAQSKGQMTAIIADGYSNDPGDEDWRDATEYYVLLVAIGHIEDLKTEAV